MPHASGFQDHLVLETKVDFRIILRLENALASGCLTRHHAVSLSWVQWRVC